MIRDAAENLGEEKASCFDFRTLDCQKLPFPDAEYDRIIANHVLFYVQNLSRGLQEISRVLSDDGVFYCSTYGKGHMKEITDLVQEFDPQINLSEVAAVYYFWSGSRRKAVKALFWQRREKNLRGQSLGRPAGAASGLYPFLSWKSE